MQQTSATTYDADEEVASTTDALGHTTTYTRDSFGRLLTTAQPAVSVPGTNTLVSPTTSYSYDADGNTLTETDPDENVTTYGYDSFNRVVSKSEPIALDGSGGSTVTVTARTTYAYDADGNLLEKIDADANAATTASGT